MSQEDNKTRKSLKTLQHVADDRENLVGRISKTLKHQLTQESSGDNDVKRKLPNTKEKETQANLNTKITAEDLTNPKGASETYWKIFAEKRQVALQETLDENERLRKIIDDLKEENALYKQMLDEANSFVEVIKEELANSDKDDTGIDVNDVSTADNTVDDTDNEDSDVSKTTLAKN